MKNWPDIFEMRISCNIYQFENRPKRSYYEGMKNILSALVLVAVLSLSTSPATNLLAECAMEDYVRHRQHMVKHQIEARGVRDPAVIRAMREVPRHCFVPSHLRPQAYRDGPLPIGHGQTISQPYIVALMSELLALKPDQRVLEIGTGSGYQAAVLAHMGAQVYSIEIVEPLAQKAKTVIQQLDYHNVYIKIGDGYKGWPRKAPFDGIIVTCAPSHIPEPLKDQLAEGGRMVIPVGKVYGVQRLILLRKIKGQIKEEKNIAVRFVPMIDGKGEPY